MKFKRLQRRLRLSKVLTVGLLELLWHATFQNAPDGDIGRLSNQEIANQCDYEDDADELVVALVQCEWLMECKTRRLIVVDWVSVRREYREPGSYRQLDVPKAEWNALRSEVIARDGLICTYCGSTVVTPHIDHIVPLSREGKSVIENLCVSCQPCNSSKQDKTPEEWSGRGSN